MRFVKRQRYHYQEFDQGEPILANPMKPLCPTRKQGKLVPLVLSARRRVSTRSTSSATSVGNFIRRLQATGFRLVSRRASIVAGSPRTPTQGHLRDFPGRDSKCPQTQDQSRSRLLPETRNLLLPLLSSVLHRSIEVGEYVGGTPEVGRGDLPEVDGMVSCLELPDHPALQVGERLGKEWGPRLSLGVR
jgi:hypothetical protein